MHRAEAGRITRRATTRPALDIAEVVAAGDRHRQLRRVDDLWRGPGYETTQPWSNRDIVPSMRGMSLR